MRNFKHMDRLIPFTQAGFWLWFLLQPWQQVTEKENHICMINPFCDVKLKLIRYIHQVIDTAAESRDSVAT